MNIKKHLIYIAVLILFIVFVSLLVLNGLGLVKVHNRAEPNSSCLSTQIKTRIKQECSGNDVNECILYGLNLTSDLLKFSRKNDIDNGVANCVGYAQLCSAICNYSFNLNGIRSEARPVVGYITFYGADVCSFLKNVVPNEYKNFVKDHDFVEVDLNDRIMYIDASLYDYGINCTTIVHKY